MPTDPETNVVDNGSDDPNNNAQVLVTVTSKQGELLEGVKVVLVDHGGGAPDTRTGFTEANGKVLFIEAVGPPPANRWRIELPAWGITHDLGRVHRRATLERMFSVGKEPTGPSTPPTDRTLSTGAVVLGGLGLVWVLRNR